MRDRLARFDGEGSVVEREEDRFATRLRLTRLRHKSGGISFQSLLLLLQRNIDCKSRTGQVASRRACCSALRSCKVLGQESILTGGWNEDRPLCVCVCFCAFLHHRFLGAVRAGIEDGCDPRRTLAGREDGAAPLATGDRDRRRQYQSGATL